MASPYEQYLYTLSPEIILPLDDTDSTVTNDGTLLTDVTGVQVDEQHSQATMVHQAVACTRYAPNSIATITSVSNFTCTTLCFKMRADLSNEKILELSLSGSDWFRVDFEDGDLRITTFVGDNILVTVSLNVGDSYHVAFDITGGGNLLTYVAGILVDTSPIIMPSTLFDQLVLSEVTVYATDTLVDGNVDNLTDINGDQLNG